MKKNFLPYYFSRALLSAVFAVLIVGFNWKALLLWALFFGFFLLYLHSGWFQVNAESKFLPLRRDNRGQLIQRKALILAIVLGLVAFFTLSLVADRLDLALLSGQIALGIAVITYFVSQFVLFSRT